MGGAFLVLCSDSAMDQSSIPRSWEGLLPWGLFLVVEEDTICSTLLLGIPAILSPLEFADLVDTRRVLAEAAPFVVVCFVVGSDVFFGCARCAFWGFFIAIMHAITHRVAPGYSRHCVGPDADVSQCVWGRHSFDRCDVLDSMNRRTCLDGVRTWTKLSKAFLTVWEAMHHK